MAKRPDYVKRFKAIKSYVSFTYKDKTLASRRLNLKQKRKITKYFNEVSKLKNRPYQIYKSKSSKRVLAAQKYSGQKTRLYPQMKVAFIPTGSEQKIKVKFSGGKISIQEGYTHTTEYLFDTAKLVKDPEGYTEKVIRNVKADTFQIMAGEFAIPLSYSKDRLPSNVLKLVNKYTDDRTILVNGKKRHNYHRVSDWMVGVRAVKSRKQSTSKKYVSDKAKFILEQKRKRAAESKAALRNAPKQEIKELKKQIVKLKKGGKMPKLTILQMARRSYKEDPAFKKAVDLRVKRSLLAIEKDVLSKFTKKGYLKVKFRKKVV